MDLALESGTLNLRGSEEPASLTGPLTLVGQVDEFTGAISAASFSAATQSFEFQITDPIPEWVYVDATFSEVVPGSVSGSVSKVTDSAGLGKVDINLSLQVDLDINVGNPPIIPTQHCNAKPITLNLESTVPYDPASELVTLADANFTVPPVTVTGCGRTWGARSSRRLRRAAVSSISWRGI